MESQQYFPVNLKAQVQLFPIKPPPYKTNRMNRSQRAQQACLCDSHLMCHWPVCSKVFALSVNSTFRLLVLRKCFVSKLVCYVWCKVLMLNTQTSFLAPWRVGNAVVGRGNAGWTTSKSGHSCPCQNCSKEPPAEGTGMAPQLNRPACPSDDPIGKGTELN